jgi:hypothetical protein
MPGAEVLAANAANNARGDARRHRRWRTARRAAWELLEAHVRPGARVLVVGAGNGDTLPLGELAARAATVELVDLDADALARACDRVRHGDVRARVADVTGGAADAVIAGRAPVAVPPEPLGDGAYDIAICDLVLSQLLYPALKGSGRGGAEIDDILLRDGQRLTDGVIARLHASTPGGTVVVAHDLLGWWKGHQQPFALDEVLRRARTDVPGAVRLARGSGSIPYGCDPWQATARAGARVVATRLWRWPFALGADYLVCGLVTRRP